MLLLLGVTVAPVSAPQGDGAAPADSIDFRLAEHQWTHRLLIVFVPSRNTASYQHQMRQFADADAGFRERDLLLVEVVDDGPSRLGTAPLSAASATRLRDRLGVQPSAFRVVLIGKDGTEKRRDEQPVTARSLFETIDAMPMRQREMREGGGGTR